MTDSRIKKVTALYKTEGPVIRASALRSAGFCGKDADELIQLGLLQRLRRGYYVSPMTLNDIDTYEILSALAPDAVISLFSAAQYHDLSSVIPQKIDITLPVQKRVPILPDDIRVNIYKAIPRIYETGIQMVKKNGYPMKIYDRERTVCDFFRMRNQIGKDCAFEVLKNYMAGKKHLQKLSEYAEILQIKGVISPYVEVLVA
jgi:predicted transcriptional regulator of viral defense system